MGAESLPIRIEELLAHAGWVRALAYRLVQDAGVADDVVQETWLAALRRPPGDRRNLRGWLGRAVTNAARRRGRARAFEGLAADPSAGEETPEELAAAVESQQALARHVLALDEPYRSTVILRYWHGLDSAQIARRQGVPAGTVRWRLQEALERLRVRLDATHGGDRRAWCLTLAPLLRRGGAGVGAAALPAFLHGVLGMHLAFKLTLAAGVLALALVGLRGLARTSPSSGPSEPHGSAVPLVAAHAEQPSPEERRRALAQAPPRAPSAPAPAPAPGGGRITARVLDLAGQPVAEATLRAFASGERSDASDADGELVLALDLPRGPAQLDLVVLAPASAALHVEAVARPGETVELGDLLLSPGGWIRGRVLGPEGGPVEGATVSWVRGAPPAGDPLRARLERSASGAYWRDERTDTEGRFTLRGVATGEVTLWAEREGLLATPSAPLALAAGGTIEDVELVLGSLPREDVISGRVLDPEGEPVAYAPVRFRYSGWFSSGTHMTTTDRDGRFEELCERGGARQVQASDPEGRWSDAVREGVRPGTHGLELRLGAPRTLLLDATGPDGARLAALDAHLWNEERTTHYGPRRPLTPTPEGLWPLPAPGLPFVVVVSAPGHEERVLGPFDPSALPERVPCALRALPGVRGTVRAGGAPLAGARMEVTELAHGWTRKDGFPVRVEAEPRAAAVSDAAGRVCATLRESGRFLVRVEADGWAAREHGPFVIDPERGLDLETVELDAGGTLEGFVHAAPGESPAGRIVGISRGDGHARTQRVGADGAYRFEHLIPGRWQVELRERELHPGGSSWENDDLRPAPPLPWNCSVSMGTSTRFDLTTEDAAPCVLEGTLRVDGAPAVGWEARLLDPEARVVSDAPGVAVEQGRFRLTRATPGRVRLSLRGGCDGALQAELELRAGTSAWSAEIERASLDVEGLDAWPDARAPAALYLWSRGDLRLVAPLYPDAEGRVEGLRLPAGPGRLVRFDPLAAVEDPFALPDLLVLDLPAGETRRVRVP